MQKRAEDKPYSKEEREEILASFEHKISRKTFLANVEKGARFLNLQKSRITPGQAKRVFGRLRAALKRHIEFDAAMQNAARRVGRPANEQTHLNKITADPLLWGQLYSAAEDCADREGSLPDREAALVDLADLDGGPSNHVLNWPIQEQIEEALKSPEGRAWLLRVVTEAERRCQLDIELEGDAAEARAPRKRKKATGNKRLSGNRPNEALYGFVRYLTRFYFAAAKQPSFPYYIHHKNKAERESAVQKLSADVNRHEADAKRHRNLAAEVGKGPLRERMVRHAEASEELARSSDKRAVEEAASPTGEAQGELLRFLRACLLPLDFFPKGRFPDDEALRGIWRRADGDELVWRKHFEAEKRHRAECERVAQQHIRADPISADGSLTCDRLILPPPTLKGHGRFKHSCECGADYHLQSKRLTRECEELRKLCAELLQRPK